jgi:hypothetical protein
MLNLPSSLLILLEVPCIEGIEAFPVVDVSSVVVEGSVDVTCTVTILPRSLLEVLDFTVEAFKITNDPSLLD